jgi:hypothetical protein
VLRQNCDAPPSHTSSSPYFFFNCRVMDLFLLLEFQISKTTRLPISCVVGGAMQSRTYDCSCLGFSTYPVTVYRL